MRPELLWDFFPRGFKGMHEGYLFLKLWNVWKSNPLLKNSVGLLSNFSAALWPDQKVTCWQRHTPEQVAHKGESLIFFSLKPSLLHPFHQLVCFPKSEQILPAKMTKIDWLLSIYEPRILPWHLRNKLFPKTDSLMFPIVSADPLCLRGSPGGLWHLSVVCSRDPSACSYSRK